MIEATYGVLSGTPLSWWLPATFVVFVGLLFNGAPLALWSLVFATLLYGLAPPAAVWIAFGTITFVFNMAFVRRRLLSSPTMKLMRRSGFFPTISETERIAIEAGTVWVDGELFSGKPDLARLVSEPYPCLGVEEQAFLDGPAREVCRMTDDWEVEQRRDLSEEVWQYLKEHRFFGLGIPKTYGGLGFSLSAVSAVVQKMASRNGPLSMTVMVPNSIGPAELLTHYGTSEQKDYWLPRLARGEEIPCFALTEADAGSDAGSISSHGVVYRDDDGQLYIQLEFNKRYITLGGVATVLGLAFRLYDPENLLGQGEDVGITCALISTDLPGVDHTRRHDPLGVPFVNSPIRGHKVVVPATSIIGGVEWAGRGWQMLMESLAAGRGVALPASSTGGVKLVARVAGAYAAVRRQFGLPIGKFEGIQEALARISGFAYLLDAGRRYTCGSLDCGAKPAVITAIAKYNFTEVCRRAFRDGMDVLGGKAIARGPRNLLAHGYIAQPIGITVEGANILTRTLMIFGQGAIRCHPFAYTQIRALAAGDVVAFDRALWGHVGHVVRNGCRALLLSLSRGLLARSPVSGPGARYFRRLAWSSASFAFLADVAMAVSGANLKRREMITGRFADIFSWMYLATAVLRRFEAEGRREADLPLFYWSIEYAFGRIQEGFDGLLQNLDLSFGLGILRRPLAVWSRLNLIGCEPSDRLSRLVATALQVPGEQRDRLTSGIHIPRGEEEPVGLLERAFEARAASEAVFHNIRAAIHAGILEGKRPAKLVGAALEAGVIDASEVALIERSERLCREVVEVDSFSLEAYMLGAVPAAAKSAPQTAGMEG